MSLLVAFDSKHREVNETCFEVFLHWQTPNSGRAFIGVPLFFLGTPSGLTPVRVLCHWKLSPLGIRSNCGSHRGFEWLHLLKIFGFQLVALAVCTGTVFCREFVTYQWKKELVMMGFLARVLNCFIYVPLQTCCRTYASLFSIDPRNVHAGRS